MIVLKCENSGLIRIKIRIAAIKSRIATNLCENLDKCHTLIVAKFRVNRMEGSEVRADSLLNSVFRCENQMNSINIRRSISKTVWSIALKIGVHAHWHVLRQCYKFREDSLSRLGIMRTLLF